MEGVIDSMLVNKDFDTKMSLMQKFIDVIKTENEIKKKQEEEIRKKEEKIKQIELEKKKREEQIELEKKNMLIAKERDNKKFCVERSIETVLCYFRNNVSRFDIEDLTFNDIQNAIVYLKMNANEFKIERSNTKLYSDDVKIVLYDFCCGSVNLIDEILKRAVLNNNKIQKRLNDIKNSLDEKYRRATDKEYDEKCLKEEEEERTKREAIEEANRISKLKEDLQQLNNLIKNFD